MVRSGPSSLLLSTLPSHSPTKYLSNYGHSGTASLPGPPADANLIAIGIGRGVEYYTCDNATAVPNYTGGKADLYDANDIIQYLPNEGYLHDLVKYFYNYDYGLLENSSLQALGSIYYAPKPTYDLGELGFFQGTVDYAVDSPLTNYYVRAINWAQLSNFPGNSTIHHVFRVETFGGGGPCTCEGQPQISTWQYAAEYWFYV
jgi:hypothetical protein